MKLKRGEGGNGKGKTDGLLRGGDTTCEPHLLRVRTRGGSINVKLEGMRQKSLISPIARTWLKGWIGLRRGEWDEKKVDGLEFRVEGKLHAV